MKFSKLIIFTIPAIFAGCGIYFFTPERFESERIEYVLLGEDEVDEINLKSEPSSRGRESRDKVHLAEGSPGSLKLADAIESAELKRIEVFAFSEIDLSEYLNKPLTPGIAFYLFKVRSLCRVQPGSISPSLCEEINNLELPSEFESLKLAAEGGHLEAILEFSNYIPPDYESMSQSEIDAIRKSRIDMLNKAWRSGSVEALHELSASYFNGLGVEVDLSKAYYYSKTAQVVYDKFDGDFPAAFLEENEKIMNHLEAVLYPYQKEPILAQIDSQEVDSCCIIFSPTK